MYYYAIIHKLLFISHPAEDRRLSWPEHTCDNSILAVACSEVGAGIVVMCVRC